MVVFITMLAVAFLMSPAFAAKKPIADKDLDQITAAGQATVIQFGTTVVAGGNASAKWVSIHSIDVNIAPAFDLTAEGGSQTDLRALVLNNVAGENQLATGVNIASSTAGTGEGTSQANEVKQSWGSKKDIAPNPGCAAGATCKAASIKAGAPLSVTSDVIFQVGHNVAAGGNASVRGISAQSVQFNMTPLFTLTLQAGSQTDLAALVVNNLVGQNQLATGVNIASGAVAVLDSAGKLLVDGSGGTVNTNQSNKITQCRGTPC